VRMEVSLTLPRQAVSVPLARGLVGSTLERAGVTPEIVNDIAVALTEACTNAFKHRDAGETYEVRLSLDDEFFTMDVIDRGPRFGTRSVLSVGPPGVEPEPEPEPEHGSPMGVIRALTDTVAVRGGAEGEGSVHMWKRVTWRERSPWLFSEIPRARPGER
jgi:serine/threonine-protein kinase RsbW